MSAPYLLVMDHDSTPSAQDDGSGYSFDKFMDAILVKEACTRPARAEAEESPQRRRARLRQERPLGRMYIRTGGAR